MRPRQGQFPFRYMIPDVPRKTSAAKPEKEKTSKQEEYQNALKDFKIMWISRLGSGVQRSHSSGVLGSPVVTRVKLPSSPKHPLTQIKICCD